MSGSLSHAANAEPNMTPILDMVFQLITFFMLVINFKAAEIDRQMQLPILGTARPQENKGKPMMMININDHGQFTVMGQKFTDEQATKWIQQDAKQAVVTAKRQDKNWIDGDDLPTLVIIRADKASPFSRLSYVIKACQDAGYRDFAFRAAGPAK